MRSHDVTKPQNILLELEDAGTLGTSFERQGTTRRAGSSFGESGISGPGCSGLGAVGKLKKINRKAINVFTYGISISHCAERGFVNSSFGSSN